MVNKQDTYVVSPKSPKGLGRNPKGLDRNPNALRRSPKGLDGNSNTLGRSPKGLSGSANVLDKPQDEGCRGLGEFYDIRGLDNTSGPTHWRIVRFIHATWCDWAKIHGKIPLSSPNSGKIAHPF